MQTNFFFLTLLIFVFFLSCSNSSETGSYNLSLVKIEPDKLSKMDILDLIEDIEIIPLETNNESLIERIYRLKTDHEHYYIQEMNNSPIKKFTKEGYFISAIGHRGQGRGEYIQITDFLVNDDTLSLFTTAREGKRIRYSGKNDFLYETDGKFPFDAICQLNDNSYLLHVGHGIVSEECSHYLYHIDEKFKIKSRLFLKKPPINNNLGMHQTYFSQKNNEILYSKNSCDTIYSIDNQLNIEPKYRLDFGRHWFTKAFLEENYTKDPVSIYNALNQNSIAKFIMFQELDDNLVISYTIHKDKEDKNFLAIYNDKEKKVYNYPVSDLYPLNKLFFNLYAGENEYFISFVSADTFLEVVSSYQEDNHISRKMKEIAINIDEVDNPLIIRYKLHN